MANQEDVDMTTSLTLPPLGQNHDRQRVDMDIDVDPSPDVEWVDAAGHELAGRGSAEARDDAMDTTADVARESAPPADHHTSLQDATQTSPSENQTSVQTDSATPRSPLPEATEPVPVLSSATPTSQETTAHAPEEPAALASPNSPQLEQQHEADEDDSSSDDENMSHSWHEIREDTSAPDERELKEIVAAGEVSALNHNHWESKAFTDLKEPEYKPTASGRIEWLIERFNGTKERPNTEVVMRSEPVRIGGYEWRIKLYPRGNDSEYLSVYVENVTVEGETTLPDSPNGPPGHSAEVSKAKPTGKRKAKSLAKTKASPQNIQPLLPLLDASPIPERPSVAAQISIVMYNPAEPRVNHQGISLHRFCPNAPDFGFRHFYGMHYEISIRRRGMRAAMLRNDRLAFTAYIRTIDDATGCLGEHTENNPWDSYVMTGICSLRVPSRMEPGGNLISVVSSWMLLKPFRQLLYDSRAPNPALDEYDAPKPLLVALQKILYMLRGYSPRSVSLEDILHAFEWYGLSTDIKALDALYLTDMLRTKLQQELEGTKFANRLTEIFGPPKNPATGIPSYRVPVKQGQQGQHISRAVADASDLVNPSALPQVLQLELGRQEFDTEKRAWKKVVDKMRLDDHIFVQDVGYTLYGFIVHKDHLQSGLYCSVLRPRGPVSKWFSFSDSKDGYQVRCLTRRAAVTQHEGRSLQNADKHTSDVAYVVYYIRDDITTHAFQTIPEPWTVPSNVMLSVRPKREIDSAMAGNANAVEQGSTSQNGLGKKSEPVTFFAFHSSNFTTHEGPGLVDIFDTFKRKSPHVFKITVNPNASSEQIQQQLADKMEWVKNPRNIVYWHVFAIGPYNLGHASLANSQDADLGCKNPNGERICSQRKENSGVVSLLWVYAPSETDPPPPPRQFADDTPMRGAEEVDAVQTLIAMAGMAGPSAQTSSQQPNTDSQMGGTQDAQPAPIPGLNMLPSTNEQSEEAAVMDKPENWRHIVLKLFNAETQSLQHIAAFMAPKDADVDTTVRNRLNLSKSQKYTLYQEIESRPWVLELTGLTDKTFSSFKLSDLTLLIAQLIPILPADTSAEDHTTSLAAKGHFSTPALYIEHRILVRNFQHLASGTLKLGYFSSEFYSGDILHGLPHGSGTAIYHSGHTYTGSFALGQRQGHGLMLYATGDSYEGDWRAGLRHGTGTFVERETGNSYSGGWKADKRFGEGTTLWKRVQEVEHVCRVCWMGEADTAFYDCGHVVACGACAGQVDTCPVCRRRVIARLKLYFVT